MAELEDGICQAYQQGYPIRRVAKMFNVSCATVYNVLNRRNIPLTRRSGKALFCLNCEIWIPLSKAGRKKRPTCPTCGRRLADKTTRWLY
jgi:transposase-like protein